MRVVLEDLVPGCPVFELFSDTRYLLGSAGVDGIHLALLVLNLIQWVLATDLLFFELEV